MALGVVHALLGSTQLRPAPALDNFFPWKSSADAPDAFFTLVVNKLRIERGGRRREEASWIFHTSASRGLYQQTGETRQARQFICLICKFVYSSLCRRRLPSLLQFINTSASRFNYYFDGHFLFSFFFFLYNAGVTIVIRNAGAVWHSPVKMTQCFLFNKR